MALNINNPKKYNRILGIEISESDIIASEISFEKNNVNILSGFRLQIPVLQDADNTAALIKETLNSYNIKTKDCVVGFSMQYFKLFPVSIPSSIPKDEISSIIVQEGNVDPNSNFFSWIPLNNTKRQDSDGISRLDVLGISIEQSLVETAKLITKNCNLKLVSIVPSFLGFGSLLNPASIKDLVGTLWISQIKSELIVWSGQEPIYEHLFLTHELNEQVSQSISYIQNQLGDAKFSSIFICGPSSREINLQLPSLTLNIKPFPLPGDFIDKGNILNEISPEEIITSASIAFAGSNNSLYALPKLLAPAKSKVESTNSEEAKDIFKDISIGGLKGINFSFNFSKLLDQEFSKFIFGSVAILVISFMTSLCIENLLIPSVQAYQTSFESRIGIAQVQFSKMLNFEKTNKILNVKVNYFAELIDKRKPWSRILREIGDMAPKGLWIDRLEIKNNYVDIFGRALTVDGVANFSINLNYTATLLGKAQIISLRKLLDEGTDIIEFQVTAKVKDENKIANTKEQEKISKTDTKNPKI